MYKVFFNRILSIGICLALLASCAADLPKESRYISQVQNQAVMGGVFSGKWFQAPWADIPYEGVPNSGELRFPDGRIYTGEFTSSGRRTEGNFQLKLAKGTMVYPDGRKAEGFFYDTRSHGRIKYPNGDEYLGYQINGKPDGKGRFVSANGDSITGTFAGGRPHGMALEFKGSTGFYGPFANGVKNGVGYCVSGGVASTCSRKGEADNSAQALQEIGAERAQQKLKDELKAEQDKVENDFKGRLAQKRATIDQLVQQRTLAEGPTRDNDFNCFCTIREMCLTVRNKDMVVDKKLEALQDERRQLECRNKYADWLKIGKSPDFARRKAELDQQIAKAQQNFNDELEAKARRKKAVEAEAARQAANNAMMARLRAQETAKEEARWKQRLEDERAQCRNGPLKPADCRCAALLNTPSVPGGVCAQ